MLSFATCRGLQGEAAMEEEIGRVTHYYSHLQVAVLSLSSPLRKGDHIHIKGHSTDFTQAVESMEIEHQPVEEGGPGDDVAIKAEDRVREHDAVFKVT